MSSSASYCDPSDLTTDEGDQSGDEDSTAQTSIAPSVRIEQFVRRVVDFSSQYGSDASISFTAQNITGRPTKFPSYGDFPETFAMRTYGPWSQRSPSRCAEIMPQTVPPFASQDYITLEFEEFVWPTRISIFESYNPGAVCEIWALHLSGWQRLWRQQPHALSISGVAAPEQQRSRVFSPPLVDLSSPTRCIRLDFYHRHLDYFAELDGVVLVGRRVSDTGAALLREREQHARSLGRIQRGLDAVDFRARPASDALEAAQLMDEFLSTGLERFAQQDDLYERLGVIQTMPHEILLQIAGYLDLVSLCRLSETCRQLRIVACDPILYTALNLRPYWAHPPAAVLDTLQTRCTLLRQLDLSWSCSLGSGVQSTDIQRFIVQCGATLTHLRLNSCFSLTAACLRTIAENCGRLTELSVRNFREAHLIEAGHLAPLALLERLDLYHTEFATEVIVDVLARNGGLRHLNLGHGSTQTNMDAVAVQLSHTNCALRSLDMWKSFGLSATGLAALAACVEMEELDIGWCLRDEAALGDSLQTVLGGCGASLRRLGLASIRGLVADDLDAIVRSCGRMEQLELMGIRGVSSEKCLDILNQCRRLEMLDVSFCDSIDVATVSLLRQRFPHVAIKKSFGDDADDGT